MTTNPTDKVNVSVQKSTLGSVNLLAKKRKKSAEQTIIDAVNLEIELRKIITDGGRIILERQGNDKIEELTL